MPENTQLCQEQGSIYSLLSKYRSELMGFASLWVMLFHAFHLHPTFGPIKLFKSLGFAGVDIFILLSGMGLCLSLARREEEGSSLRTYFLRRVERILPTYWLVVGIYSLWLRIQGRISLTVAAWSLSTLHYWFHIPGSFNWYIPAALAFYLIAPFYWKLFCRCKFKGLLTALLFPFAYGLYRLAIPLGVVHMQDFIYRIPAFGLGVLMGYYLLNKQELTVTHATVWSWAAACGIILGILCWKKDLYIPTCYLFGLALVSGTLLLAKILDYLHWNWLHRPLRVLGACSLEIYLLNVIITREFEVLAPLFDVDSKHIIYYIIVYAINLFLGIVLHKGIKAGKAALIKWYRGRKGCAV